MNKIVEQITAQGPEVWVCSYGGSACNQLADFIEEQLKLKVRCQIWGDSLCHYPKPLNCGIPMVYIYDDIDKAFLSVKRRNKSVWNIQKLSDYKITNNSDDKILFELMIKQFNEWSVSHDVFMIHRNDFFRNKTKQKELLKYLKIDNKNIIFPAKKQKGTLTDSHPLFDTYKNDIQKTYH